MARSQLADVRRPGRPRQEADQIYRNKSLRGCAAPGAEHPRRFLSVSRPAYDSPVSAEDATRPRRAPRPRSETRKMTSPTAIDTTVIVPTARSHPDLVKMGAQG